ncbi:MAG: hypothetical protein HC809_03295 [Gammaproteobacteria bacterium]|nr:hypothetical protein [Gammaproteobacteria bacterium]
MTRAFTTLALASLLATTAPAMAKESVIDAAVATYSVWVDGKGQSSMAK